MTTAIALLPEKQAVLDEMTPAARKFAEQFMARDKKMECSEILSKYAHGQALKEAMEDVANYGPSFIQQLARYTKYQASALYGFKLFAERFPKETVEKLMNVRTANGAAFSFAHFQQLAMIEDPKQRREVMDKTIRAGWTARELSDEIQSMGDKLANSAARRRGRPVAKPTSIAAGIRQIISNATTLCNRIPVLRESVWAPLQTQPPDQIDIAIEEGLMEALSNVRELRKSLADQEDWLQKALDRVHKVAEKRPASNGHASSNGHTPTAKKKKPIAAATSRAPHNRRMPQLATAKARKALPPRKRTTAK